jgi:hypothetical protein
MKSEEFNRILGEAPYLLEEDFLFMLQTTYGNDFVNLHDFNQIADYTLFLSENGYDTNFFVDLKEPILKGRYVLEAVKIFPKEFFTPKELVEMADETGRSIEQMLDDSLMDRTFSSKLDSKGRNRITEGVIYYLDELRRDFPLDVFSYYVEMYNSFVEQEMRGMLKPKS